MTLETFEALTPTKRLVFANENPKWLESLNERDLDNVGRLLCHASSKESRTSAPIIGDLTLSQEKRLQAEFEESIFGENATRRGEMPSE